MDKKSLLRTYNKKFVLILHENLEFLQKVIINMHAIEIEKDVKSHNLAITRPIGLAKILLIETLSLMIQNDQRNNYKMISRIHETTWDTIIWWLLDKE